MAATRIIEEERGVFVGHVHTHNGYYAGDFSRRVPRTPVVPSTHPVAPVPARPFIDVPPRRPSR
jgi:hypothetical protein